MKLFRKLFAWKEIFTCKKLIEDLWYQINIEKKVINSHREHEESFIQELLLKMKEKETADQMDYLKAEVEGLYKELCLWDAYDLLEKSSIQVYTHLSSISKRKRIPPDLEEAVSTLIFAPPQCAIFTPLRKLRKVFQKHYGYSEKLVNKKLQKNLCVQRMPDYIFDGLISAILDRKSGLHFEMKFEEASVKGSSLESNPEKKVYEVKEDNESERMSSSTSWDCFTNMSDDEDETNSFSDGYESSEDAYERSENDEAAESKKNNYSSISEEEAEKSTLAPSWDAYEISEEEVADGDEAAEMRKNNYSCTFEDEAEKSSLTPSWDKYEISEEEVAEISSFTPSWDAYESSEGNEAGETRKSNYSSNFVDDAEKSIVTPSWDEYEITEEEAAEIRKSDYSTNFVDDAEKSILTPSSDEYEISEEEEAVTSSLTPSWDAYESSEGDEAAKTRKNNYSNNFEGEAEKNSLAPSWDAYEILENEVAEIKNLLEMLQLHETDIDSFRCYNQQNTLPVGTQARIVC